MNRALPCSSTFTPVAAPIGFSGDFSSAGRSVFSAHCFSAGEGVRFSKTSAMGDGAGGLVGVFADMGIQVSGAASMIVGCGSGCQFFHA